jgi:hypothetical protein
MKQGNTENEKENKHISKYQCKGVQSKREKYSVTTLEIPQESP